MKPKNTYSLIIVAVFGLIYPNVLVSYAETRSIHVTPARTLAFSQTTSHVASSRTTLKIDSADKAVAYVKDGIGNKMKTDATLHIEMDHVEKASGHTVYVVHVFDKMVDHTATIYWIDVRDDGMLQDDLLSNGWQTLTGFFNKR